MWEQYQVPKNEGTRIHRIGSTLICVVAVISGEGDLLSAMPMYDSVMPSKSPARKKAVLPLALPPLDDSVWSRFFIDASEHYELMPGYPQMPVCVQLREAFSLPPGADLKGWIFSRIEARILVSGTELVSFPLARPYKTLYGTPESGVICRHDEAQFLNSSEPMFESMFTDPGLVAHPVRLRNTSSTAVRVTELCIYGEQLSIFWTGARMQSEQLLFVFGSSGVRMSLDGQGPLPADCKTITKPRVSGEERFIERSFELFKAMTRL